MKITVQQPTVQSWQHSLHIMAIMHYANAFLVYRAQLQHYGCNRLQLVGIARRQVSDSPIVFTGIYSPQTARYIGCKVIHLLWYLPQSTNICCGICHSLQTSAVVSAIVYKHLSWYLPQSTNICCGVCHSLQTSAVVSAIVYKHLLWYLPQSTNICCGICHSLQTFAVVSAIVYKHLLWYLPQSTNICCGICHSLQTSAVVSAIVYKHLLWYLPQSTNQRKMGKQEVACCVIRQTQSTIAGRWGQLVSQLVSWCSEPVNRKGLYQG